MEYAYSQYVISKKIQEVIPQVRMFFEVEDRKNSFVMSRRKKHLQMQTYTRYGTGSVVMFDYAESPVRDKFKRRFRTDRLTRLVPAPVRFVLRND